MAELRAAPPRRAVRRPRRAARGDARSDEDRYPGFDGLRTPQWHYIRWLTGRRELYDVQADPWEQDNLVKTESTRAAEMEARLDELIVDSGGPPPSLPE